MSLLLRLAVGSGRSAAVRLALVVLGTAFAAALLLTATGVATLSTAELGVTTTGPDGSSTTYAGTLRSAYLVEPELRRGVVLGFVLCVVPLLVFVGTASRVAARRREERLAGLRLAGATDGQARLLAALDTACGAGVGVVLGGGLFLLVRAAVLATTGGQVRALAAAVLPPLPHAVGVLLVLVAGAAAASAVALRQVSITPLGVVRRAPRRRPRPWGLLLLLTGLVAFAAAAVADRTSGEQDAALALALVLVLLGLVTCGPWLTSLTGRAAGRAARGPALLLAGRRLEDEPRAQARAMSAVVLVVLSATIALAILPDYRQGDRDDASLETFYAQGFQLAAVGMAFSLAVAAAGLLLTTLEGLLERRRTLAVQHASGVPVSVLARSVLLQVGLPVLPAAALAVLSGLAVVAVLEGAPAAPAIVLLLPPAAVLACLLSAACTLPALRRTTDEGQLRVP